MSQNSQPCVLVVEDDDDTRFMLKTMLELRRIRVLEATEGETAIALAENVRLDLILMDGTLPILDGYETTRRIRARTFPRNIPIIFLSGNARTVDQDKAFAAGCTEYLVKPFDLDELDRVLERNLSGNTRLG